MAKITTAKYAFQIRAGQILWQPGTENTCEVLKAEKVDAKGWAITVRLPNGRVETDRFTRFDVFHVIL